MEFHELFGIGAILRESIELLPRTNKLMSYVTIISLFFIAEFFVIFNFFIDSWLPNILTKQSLIPTSTSNSALVTILTGMKEHSGLLLLVYFAFVLSCFFLSFFNAITTIYISAISYSRKTISIKDFLLTLARTWTRPLVTVFYTTLLAMGYLFLLLAMASPLLMFSKTTILVTIIAGGLVAWVVYLYLSVVWVLALVVSILEKDCYGIEALGKAGGLVKGKRLHGFALNVLFGVLSGIIYWGFKTLSGDNWMNTEALRVLMLANVSCLSKMMQLIAYTVLYFHCKKNHEEEIELQGSGAVEYAKLSTTDIP